MGINLRTLTDEELLRFVDRSHPAVFELAARMERILYGQALPVAGAWQQLELRLEFPEKQTAPAASTASALGGILELPLPRPAPNAPSQSGPARFTRHGSAGTGRGHWASGSNGR